MESDGVDMVPLWTITVLPVVLIQIVLWPLLYCFLSTEWVILCIIGSAAVYFAYGYVYSLTVEGLNKKPVVITGLNESETIALCTFYRLRSRLRQNARAEISGKRRANLCSVL